MVRKSKVDTCLFCGETPCTCNAKPKSKTVPRTNPRPVASDKPPVPASAPARKSMLEAMRATAIAGPKVTTPFRDTTSKSHRVIQKTEQDVMPGSEQAAIKSTILGTERPIAELQFEAAIRSFEKILHPEEKIKYRSILTATPTLVERKRLWKARKEEGEEVNGSG